MSERDGRDPIDLLFDEIDGSERLRLEAEVDADPAARRELAELGEVLRQTARRSRDEPSPALLAGLKAEARKRTAEVRVEARRASAAVAPPPGLFERFLTTLRRSAAVPVWAAAVLLVVIGGGLVLRAPDEPSPEAAALAPADSADSMAAPSAMSPEPSIDEPIGAVGESGGHAATSEVAAPAAAPPPPAPSLERAAEPPPPKPQATPLPRPARRIAAKTAAPDRVATPAPAPVARDEAEVSQQSRRRAQLASAPGAASNIRGEEPESLEELQRLDDATLGAEAGAIAGPSVSGDGEEAKEWSTVGQMAALVDAGQLVEARDSYLRWSRAGKSRRERSGRRDAGARAMVAEGRVSQAAPASESFAAAPAALGPLVAALERAAAPGHEGRPLAAALLLQIAREHPGQVGSGGVQAALSAARDLGRGDLERQALALIERPEGSAATASEAARESRDAPP